MKQVKLLISTAFLLIFGIGCRSDAGKTDTATSAEGLTNYPIAPVDIRNVKVTDAFWLPVIERVQEKTIEYAIDKCAEEGRMDNFLIAGGKMEGDVKGAMPFDDTDLYKIIEGASNSLISSPNAELEMLLDSLIGIIATGQEEDGYLTTWRTIDPAKPPAPWVEVKEGKRWESLSASHELYNAGHLYEAAYTHFKATGKRNFLDIALKNADLMVETFGEGEGKIGAVPGHQIIETGLIKLYQVTGREDYLQLAKYFLDNRGNPENHELFGPYSQDHLPVTQQDEVVGHAVRAVYMYAAMTDIAAIYEDTAYLQAVDKLWHNMVEKKMYLTGGIGAKHEGESFGENYELPNLTAYNETCASIGSVYWNHRLHSLTGNSDYFDVIERTLYNGLISGLSLDGTHFFYPNPLESDGVYQFNQGACTRKSWFDCSCCPTNLIRFLPAMPGLIYSKGENAVFVNLYVANEASVALDGNMVHLAQQTNYPWDGKVNLTVQPEKGGEFTLKLRIPSWARNQVLPGNLYNYVHPSEQITKISMDGQIFTPENGQGYYEIRKTWNAGETLSLEIEFPMQVKMVTTHPKVAENQGKAALEYGPVVFAVEAVDNPDNYDSITVDPDDQFVVRKEEDLLGGVNVLQNDKLKAIPYYAWSNRKVGKMKVWLDFSDQVGRTSTD